MIQKIISCLQALIIGLFVLLICYPLIIVLEYQLIFRNRIYPKITIIGLNMAGKSQQQGIDLLQKKIADQPLTSLVFDYQTKNWIFNLADFNFHYLPKTTITKAYNLGRDNKLQTNILTKWQLWKNSTTLPLDYELDQKLLEEKIATLAALIDIPSIPQTIVLKTTPKKGVEISLGQEGQKMDEEKLRQLINQHLSQLKSDKISLPTIIISSFITNEQAQKTKVRAEKLLNKTIKLAFQNNDWELNDQEIINFIGFNNNFDEEKIASYSGQLAQFIDRPAQNALFNFLPSTNQNEQAKMVEFKPAQNGQKLDQERTTKLLLDALIGLEKAENKTAMVNLPVALIKPQIETKNVNNLGIKELIGKGESWFIGSIGPRIYNIKLAAQKLNGFLIPPQEIFSFNQAIGEISNKTGFQPAYVIKEGRTVLDDGGGVCQVSTTIFRAALNAGLPIEERKSHAYRVAYYEKNSQVGVDATIFAPTADFKFKNDTPAYILLQPEIDLASQKLTFFIFGTADGREVTISQSKIWDQIPPPPDLYQDDPALPNGIIKQVDWKAWGAKIAFDWKVVRGDEVLQERTFYSNYRPWQAIFLKGTGN